MKKPTKEWEMVCDLMLEMEHHHLRNPNQENFIEELYQLLDEFSPFLSQRSEDQLKYLRDLHVTYCDEGNETEIDIDC